MRRRPSLILSLLGKYRSKISRINLRLYTIQVATEVENVNHFIRPEKLSPSHKEPQNITLAREKKCQIKLIWEG